MSVLKGLVETVGLDHTFFYQFIIISILYFVTKKLFLQRYYQDIEKRREVTKGSFSQSQEMEDKIENLKKSYDQKAQSLNKKFQDVFGFIKNSTEESFIKDREFLQEEQKKDLEAQKKTLLKNKEREDEKLKKDLPNLIQSLVGKITGRV